MNKEEFLKRLEQLLSDISEEERADALAFYRSYFEDAGEGNEASILQELESPEKVAEIIKKDLGVSDYDTKKDTSANSAEEGKQDTYTSGLYGSSAYGSGSAGSYGSSAYGSGSAGSYGTKAQPTMEQLKQENKKNKTEKTVLWVVLAVLTSPIWLTVLAVLAAIAVAVLACVFGLAVSVVAVMAALVVSGFVLAGIGIGYMATEGIVIGMGLLGGGLLVLALGALSVWLVVWCFGWFVPWAVKGIVKLCKKPFEKKKEREAA